MKEIGGYLELEKFRRTMLYEDGIKLNSGRNAISYIVRAKGIRKIWIPKYLCDSCEMVLNGNNVEINYYDVGLDLHPPKFDRQADEWLFVVNYFGQISNDYIRLLGNNIIVDNTQAYFQHPIKGVDTLYSCRKYFGVPDGAILYTDKRLDIGEKDISYARLRHILGRYEGKASDYYDEYTTIETSFVYEPLKEMSLLTENLLHGVDYEYVEKTRTRNFSYLHDHLADINRLNLKKPNGAFMYPLYLDNAEVVRRKMIKKKIYIPTLWPNVLNMYCETDSAYLLTKNILPLPVDQRYGIDDMKHIILSLKECLNM